MSTVLYFHMHTRTNKDIHGLKIHLTCPRSITTACLTVLETQSGRKHSGCELSHLQNHPNVCVCVCLYKVHDASVSMWQRAEQEAARWGSLGRFFIPLLHLVHSLQF